MEIDLRHHEDGTYVLEVRHKSLSQEIDITEIIRDVVIDKLRDVQSKLQLEERYRDWLVESAQETSKSLSTIATRYESISKRLKETTEAIQEAVELWRQDKPVKRPLKVKLANLANLNSHFLENDSGMKKLPKKE